MKNRSLGVLTLLALLLSLPSCKNEPKNEDKNATLTSQAQSEVPSRISAENYKVDTAGSSIQWTGSKPTGKHTGTIAIASGTLSSTPQHIQSGTFVIDMKSITVTDLEGKQKTGLEEHLKGIVDGKEDHFFNVEKFPTATFEITKVAAQGEKTNIEGNLTLRGIKKSISFPATTRVSPEGLSLQSEVFTINRTDWGVNYGSKSLFDNLGDKFIDDGISLQVQLKAHKL